MIIMTWGWYWFLQCWAGCHNFAKVRLWSWSSWTDDDYHKLSKDIDDSKAELLYQLLHTSTRYLTALERIMTENGSTGFFVGNKMTVADLAMWRMWGWIVSLFIMMVIMIMMVLITMMVIITMITIIMILAARIWPQWPRQCSRQEGSLTASPPICSTLIPRLFNFPAMHGFRFDVGENIIFLVFKINILSVRWRRIQKLLEPSLKWPHGWHNTKSDNKIKTSRNSNKTYIFSILSQTCYCWTTIVHF